MKTRMILVLNAMLVLSCGPISSHDEVKDFIPGVYATEWKNEFTESKDTITIVAPTIKGSTSYSISKRSYYHQTIDGKELKPQFKSQQWKGQYNPEVKTLVMEKSGRVLFFNPDSYSLIEGTTTYRKIK